MVIKFIFSLLHQVQHLLDQLVGPLRRQSPQDQLAVALLDKELKQQPPQLLEVAILVLEAVVCGGSTQTTPPESKCKSYFYTKSRRFTSRRSRTIANMIFSKRLTVASPANE